MKRIVVCLVLLSMLITGCHQEHDEVFTEGVIVLTLPEGCLVDRIQGTAVLTNVNTKEVVTTSDFEGTVLSLHLLKGGYMVSIEGVVRYVDETGATQMAQFRAYTDYMEFLVDDSPVQLEMKLM